jgi:hypothetical protein
LAGEDVACELARRAIVRGVAALAGEPLGGTRDEPGRSVSRLVGETEDQSWGWPVVYRLVQLAFRRNIGGTHSIDRLTILPVVCRQYN